MTRPEVAAIAMLLLAGLPACEVKGTTTAQQSALTVPPGELERLLSDTALVAHFKVVSATGRAGTVGTQKIEAHFTDLTLQIVTPIRGSADQVTVTILGGRVGEREMHLSDQVRLEQGDEALGFLDPAAAPHPFIGAQRGVLPIKEGRVFAFDGRPLIEVRPDGFVFGRAPNAPPPSPALEPQGNARAVRVITPDGEALTVAQAISALTALRKAP